jgi:hypothetical protein
MTDLPDQGYFPGSHPPAPDGALVDEAGEVRSIALPRPHPLLRIEISGNAAARGMLRAPESTTSSDGILL